MNNLLILFIFGVYIYGCDCLPAKSVSEAHSSASHELHLLVNNGTDGVNYQLSPIISQLKTTTSEIDIGRKAILPFMSFMFDTLGSLERAVDDCIGDMVIQLIPNDPADPGYPSAPSEPENENTPPEVKDDKNCEGEKNKKAVANEDEEKIPKVESKI